MDKTKSVRNLAIFRTQGWTSLYISTHPFDVSSTMYQIRLITGSLTYMWPFRKPTVSNNWITSGLSSSGGDVHLEEHTLFEIEMKLISQIQILMLRIRALIESRETKILTLKPYETFDWFACKHKFYRLTSFNRPISVSVKCYFPCVHVVCTDKWVPWVPLDYEPTQFTFFFQSLGAMTFPADKVPVKIWYYVPFYSPCELRPVCNLLPFLYFQIYCELKGWTCIWEAL